jgi:ABC-type sugar transport system substrate-binding protein
VGAWTALRKVGKTQSGTTIVSVDGGCAGVRNVRAGVIDATSQQYPLKMAALGVAAAVKYAKTGQKARGYTDTGVNLIAKEGSGRRQVRERRVRPCQLLGVDRPLSSRDRDVALRVPVVASAATA